MKDLTRDRKAAASAIMSMLLLAAIVILAGVIYLAVSNLAEKAAKPTPSGQIDAMVMESSPFSYVYNNEEKTITIWNESRITFTSCDPAARWSDVQLYINSPDKKNAEDNSYALDVRTFWWTESNWTEASPPVLCSEPKNDKKGGSFVFRVSIVDGNMNGNIDPGDYFHLAWETPCEVDNKGRKVIPPGLDPEHFSSLPGALNTQGHKPKVPTQWIISVSYAPTGEVIAEGAFWARQYDPQYVD